MRVGDFKTDFECFFINAHDEYNFFWPQWLLFSLNTVLWESIWSFSQPFFLFPGIHTAHSWNSLWFYLDMMFLYKVDPLAVDLERNQPNDIPVLFNIPGVVTVSWFFNPGLSAG